MKFNKRIMRVPSWTRLFMDILGAVYVSCASLHTCCDGCESMTYDWLGYSKMAEHGRPVPSVTQDNTHVNEI